ncbi:MAG: S1C family serine protease, partial [Pirellulales bacterium]|nr:S1C family serine protease [Pirellulales bacterium]
ATGHPGGYFQDRGAVTRVGRILSVRPGAIVTDCALIGGDSGGPLFDISGRLVAVHSRIGNDVADNLHVPIDNYDYSWKRLYQGESWGSLPGFRPVLGVQGSAEGDARVRSVTPHSPADRAGIEEGDVIVQFGDIVIEDFAGLKSAVSDTMPGEQVRVTLRREDRLIRLRVEIGRAD